MRTDYDPAPDLNHHHLEHLEARQLLAAGVGGDDLSYTLYYPEGYAHDAINEFVPITNTGDSDVRYELLARYETGERDQVLASGTIAAHTRGGVTVNRAGHAEDRLVRGDTPYALVLRSSGPVAATMSHYDFGTAIGESFTDRPATEWTFAEGYKDDAWTRDFVVFYNTADDDALVTLTAFTADGRQISMSQLVGGQRRGGWSLNDDSRIPDGVFGMRVTSTTPIVAALSHYEIVTGRGFGAIGTTDGGATAGVITSAEFHDRHRRHGGGGNHDGLDDRLISPSGPGGDDSGGHDDHGGNSGPGGSGDDDGSGHSGGQDDNPTPGSDDGTPDQGPGDFGGDDNPGGDDGTPDQGPGDFPGTPPTNNPGTQPGNDDGTPDQGPGDFPFDGSDDFFSNPDFAANAYITVLNTGDQDATITFTLIPHDGYAMTATSRTITVGAGARGGISVRDLGFLGDDDEFGIVYRSDVKVTVTAAIYQGNDATGQQAVDVAATEWRFGEGFMDSARAGLDLMEDVYLFNPTGQRVNVTVELFLSDGRTFTFINSLSPLELDDVRLHNAAALLGAGPASFFGIRVAAATPIVATFEHWDRTLGGGFATPGTPDGTIVPLSSVLAI